MRFLILGLLLQLGMGTLCHGQLFPDKLHGVCFSSVRENESPARQIHALPSAIEEDVAFASKFSQAIRTYTVQNTSYLIPEFCEKYDIDCIVGAWIGPARWQNDAQLELLEHLARSANKRIKAVIIGNEVLHRGDCSESQLIDYVRRAKATMDVPIASADTWRAWIEHPKLAAEVDICGVQVYPYWEGLSIDGAAEYTVRRVRDVQQQYPDKRIVLTEFGWPTAGDSLGQAEASGANAARYLREVIPLLEQNDIEYYYFAVWDEQWKVGPEGGVGAHWGLFHSDGSIKPEFRDVLTGAVHAGSKRPPRTISFGLAVDEGRNDSVTQVALGSPSSDQASGEIAGRGPGLATPQSPAGRAPYAGLRPLRLKQEEADATKEDVEVEKYERDVQPPPTSAPTPAPIDDQRTEFEKQSRRSIVIEPSSADSKQLHGVCLSLFRDNETPHLGITPLLSALREEVTFAAKLANAARTYSVSDSFAMVPGICANVGIDCFPGAALGKYPWLNDLELEMLVRIGQSDNPRVQALIVGNEVLHRGDFSVDQYIQYIRRVKQQVEIPVATAELLHSWMEHPELANEVDILGVQIYPFWGGLSIDKAAANTLQSVQELQHRFPGKRVILTEFGWPTDGGTIGDATASGENAARYLREVIPLLNQNNIEYLWFAMCDEQWKQQDEGGPGPHWGLLLSSGRVKPELVSLLPTAAAKGMRRPPRKLSFDK